MKKIKLRSFLQKQISNSGTYISPPYTQKTGRKFDQNSKKTINENGR